MTTITNIKLPELIVCAAIRYKIHNKEESECIVLGCTDYTAESLKTLKKQIETTGKFKLKEQTRGFMTNRDRFVTQQEALRLAVRHCQLRRYNSIKDPNLLFPEDIW